MLPIEAEIGLNGPVLLFTVAVTLVAGVVFGCAPALQWLRVDLSEALKAGSRAAIGGGRFRVQSLLVVAEFALAITLLAGAGLAIHSFWNLTRVDLGFRTDHILTAFMTGPRKAFSGADQIREHDRAILDKVASVPGARFVALSTNRPFGGHSDFPFSIAGQPVREANRMTADLQFVTPSFLDVFQLRLLRGRFFAEQDSFGTPRVVVVSERFASRFLAHTDPLTARVLLPQPRFGANSLGPPVDYQIIGVVNDVHYGASLTDKEAPGIYAAFWQSPFPWGVLSVRSALTPAALSGSIRRAVYSIAPGQPLFNVETMDTIVGGKLAGDRFGAVLYGAFSALALMLAAVGIYGLMSFAVAQRRNEIGVRMALGAQPGQVLRLVLGNGLRLALIGLAIGAGGAYAAGRLMQSTLYGMTPVDSASLAAVVVLLLLAALVANYLPARRATRVDPVTALRQE
jgi:putative ABC transport system permease protein